jgi:hypothetical protein
VAVRVEALERRVGGFILAFDDGDAVSFHAFQQRADVSGRFGLEAGMQERGQRLDIGYRVQGEVDPSALRIMTVPSGYFCAVAGSKPKYVE